jgi:hypothetical protein
MDTYGYLYNGSFNSSFPNQNVLLADDDDGGNHQFELTYFLQSSVTYVLVPTTYAANVMGVFSIIGTGLGLLSFSQLNITGKNLSYSKLFLQ